MKLTTGILAGCAALSTLIVVFTQATVECARVQYGTRTVLYDASCTILPSFVSCNLLHEAEDLVNIPVTLPYSNQRLHDLHSHNQRRSSLQETITF